HLAPTAASPMAKPRPLWKRAIRVATAATVLSLITGIAVWKFKPAVPPPLTRFSVGLPDGQQLFSLTNSIGISPDGTQIVYAANKRLYVRSISELDAKPVPGAEAQGLGVSNPVFSSDAASILFIDLSGPAESTIKRIPAGGGAPVTLYRGNYISGIHAEANDIVFSDYRATICKIVRIPSDGGNAETLLELKDGEWA